MELCIFFNFSVSNLNKVQKKRRNPITLGLCSLKYGAATLLRQLLTIKITMIKNQVSFFSDSIHISVEI